MKRSRKRARKSAQPLNRRITEEPSPAAVLCAAKTEIARLELALHDIAHGTDDAETLREDAMDALEGGLRFQREAEELRSGIEELTEKAKLVRSMVEDDADEGAVLVSDLLDLLHRVDARDSLAFLEMGRKGPPKSEPRRRERHAPTKAARRRNGF